MEVVLAALVAADTMIRTAIFLLVCLLDWLIVLPSVAKSLKE